MFRVTGDMRRGGEECGLIHYQYISIVGFLIKFLLMKVYAIDIIELLLLLLLS